MCRDWLRALFASANRQRPLSLQTDCDFVKFNGTSASIRQLLFAEVCTAQPRNMALPAGMLDGCLATYVVLPSGWLACPPPTRCPFMPPLPPTHVRTRTHANRPHTDTHPRAHARTHAPTHPRTHPRTHHPPTHPPTHPPMHPSTPSLPPSLPPFLPPSFCLYVRHSLTLWLSQPAHSRRSPIHSLTHSLTHSFIDLCTCARCRTPSINPLKCTSQDPSLPHSLLPHSLPHSMPHAPELAHSLCPSLIHTHTHTHTRSPCMHAAPAPRHSHTRSPPTAST